MKKNDKRISPALVLQKIDEARIKEELAIPIYSSHIKQALFWSGLAIEKQKEVIAGLRILESESEKHVKILKLIAEKYLKSSKKYV